MSLITKNIIQVAFDNADPDVMADYGPEYGAEWGFSRDAVNRILTDAFDIEKHSDAFWAIGKNVFNAYRNYGGMEDAALIIFADTLDDAVVKAREWWESPSITVTAVTPTRDPQIFEVQKGRNCNVE